MYLVEEIVKSTSVECLEAVKRVWLEAKTELQCGVGWQLSNWPPQTDPEPITTALKAKQVAAEGTDAKDTCSCH